MLLSNLIRLLAIGGVILGTSALPGMNNVRAAVPVTPEQRVSYNAIIDEFLSTVNMNELSTNDILRALQAKVPYDLKTRHKKLELSKFAFERHYRYQDNTVPKEIGPKLAPKKEDNEEAPESVPPANRTRAQRPIPNLIERDSFTLPSTPEVYSPNTINPLHPRSLNEDGTLDTAAFEAAKVGRRGVTPHQCTFATQPDGDLITGENAAYIQWVLDGICYYTIASHSSRFSIVPDYSARHLTIASAFTHLTDRPAAENKRTWRPTCPPDGTCFTADWAVNPTGPGPKASSCELIVTQGSLVDEGMLKEANVELAQWCWILLQTKFAPESVALKAIHVLPVAPQPEGTEGLLSAVRRRDVDAAHSLPLLEADSAEKRKVNAADTGAANSLAPLKPGDAHERDANAADTAAAASLPILLPEDTHKRDLQPAIPRAPDTSTQAAKDNTNSAARNKIQDHEVNRETTKPSAAPATFRTVPTQRPVSSPRFGWWRGWGERG